MLAAKFWTGEHDWLHILSDDDMGGRARVCFDISIKMYFNDGS